MSKAFLLSFFLCSAVFAQDNVILPDIELSIGDQSSVQAAEAAEALLKDRNPIFEQVYLEELSAASNRTQSTSAGYRYASQSRDLTLFRFGYGYYHQTDAYAEFQRRAGNVLYNLRYGNFSRQYAQDTNYYPESGILTNGAALTLNGVHGQTRWDASLAYKQNKTGFFGGLNRQAHYTPLLFNAKHWVGESSFITAGFTAGFLMQDHRRGGTPLRNQNMSDTGAAFSYGASFAPWVNFQASLSTLINSYNYSQIDHTTLLKALAEFLLPAGFSASLGFTLAPHRLFYGWPELALRYRYLEYLTLNLSFSGIFDSYGAKDAFDQTQAFSSGPSLESRMALRFSLSAAPHPYLRLDAYAQLNIWRDRRNFIYNNNYYALSQGGAHNTFAAGVSLTAFTPNILDFSLGYDYENIPSHFLLLPAHKTALILGLGWKPVGFRFESSLNFHSQRKMGNGENPFLFLWDLSLSQRIYKNASLYIEFNNILNTAAYYWADIPLGGFQLRGGFQLSF